MTVALPQLHPGQQRVFESEARFKVVCAGRRWGKTRYGVREALRVGLEGGRAWWVAPTYKTAMEGWVPLRQLAGRIPGAKVREADKEVTFPSNGRVAIRSADAPDSLRGAGLDFLVLDEAAFMSERVWHEILRPALADRKGSALFISTPIGFNWFYDLYMQGDVPSGKRLPEWASFHAPTSDNPFIDDAELESALAEVGSHVFSQEFMAEFVEVGGSIFKTEWFRYFQPMHLSRWETMRNEDDEEVQVERTRTVWMVDTRAVVPEDCQIFVTVDPAVSVKETADYTAMAVCAITPNQELLLLHVWRGRIEGPDILKKAESLRTEYEASMIYLERTAFQLILIQQAKREGLPVAELRADKDKIARSLPLAAKMEGGKVFFLKDAPWLDDLKREMLVFPKEEQHDDQVDALAYAASIVKLRRSWAIY